ncbi:Uncharacterized protein M6B38_241830 [Iris pallida]|uniref:Reverse transcriptase zinc-binding domain-containing protein n=1 Tax=Iris pallida TaxID=29817 RepID=A0AAX6DJ95_IRIPA|nr:Uncharacterized protein M6B38_241830 [Iris pallida]
MGFHLASRCVCCQNPMEETIDHLLVHGETAKAVWAHFADNFRISAIADDVNHLAEIWLNNICLTNTSNICRNVTFGMCLWELWKHRNKIIFDKGKRNDRDIICRVSMAVQHGMTAHKLEMGELHRAEASNRGYGAHSSSRGVLDAAQDNSFADLDGGVPLQARACSSFVVAGQGSSSSIMGGRRRRGAAIGSSRASVSSSLAEAGQGSSTGEVRGLRRSAVPDNRLNAGSAGNRGGHHRAASGSAWRPPNVGLKLNVVGYSVSSPCTAVGGIIRDSAGNLRMAFQKFFCQGTTSLPAVDATIWVSFFRKIRSLIAHNTEVVLCKKGERRGKKSG